MMSGAGGVTLPGGCHRGWSERGNAPGNRETDRTDPEVASRESRDLDRRLTWRTGRRGNPPLWHHQGYDRK